MVGKADPSADVFLAQMKLSQVAAERAQRQITSGKKIQVASDGPDEVTGILQLRAELNRNDQITTNLTSVKSGVESADAALQQVVKLLDRVTSLALQGAGTTSNADQRTALADEVAAIHQELVSLSQTTMAGRFIFSGDQDTGASYELNLDLLNGVDRLQTPTNTRQILDPTGTTFAVSRTAQDIFDERDADDNSTANNVFAAVNTLRDRLANNDPDGIQAAIVTLRQSSVHVNQELGFYGAVETRINDAINTASQNDVKLKIALSDRQDADVTEAILELNQVQLNQRAALASRGQMNKSSLFDYLK